MVSFKKDCLVSLKKIVELDEVFDVVQNFKKLLKIGKRYKMVLRNYNKKLNATQYNHFYILVTKRRECK